MLKFIALLTLLAFFCAFGSTQRPSYDHQVKTYEARFKPLRTSNANVSLMPFFSPDHSIETLVNAILEAKESIDISTPGFSSWKSCTYPDPGQTCIGCTASTIINSETFPIFQALNNALHKGIKVRILTNDYGDSMCDGKMDLLTYLQLAGAHISYYRTTTFTHSKYMAIDNKIIVISSINYTKTSIMSNREAGIVIRNQTSVNPIADFTQSVFNFDFNEGYSKTTPKYSDADLELIRNAKNIPVVVPPPYVFNYCNATSGKPVEINEHMTIDTIISPDFAFDSVFEGLTSAKESLDISIYQITDDNFCDSLIDLKASKPNLALRIFISNEIYDKEDQRLATVCNKRLYDHGIVVRLSHPSCLKFSHQKFWIVDKKVAYMSTGNMSPTDYPKDITTFPPFGTRGWRKVNRDYTVRIENSPSTIARYQFVFDMDYSQGVEFKPKASDEPKRKDHKKGRQNRKAASQKKDRKYRGNKNYMRKN